MTITSLLTPRAIFHGILAATFFFLTATGFLLFLPEFRGAVTGGYVGALRQWHRWVGVAFIVLPLPLLIRISVNAYRRERTSRRRGRQWLFQWRLAHASFTVLTTVLFAVTGLMVWWKVLFPLAVVDGALIMHRWLTYVSCVAFGAHLVIDVGYLRLGQFVFEWRNTRGREDSPPVLAS